MFETLRGAKHVLKTTDKDVQIISFNDKNEVIGRFTYSTRKSAINALTKMTGQRIELKPMQTDGAERITVHQEDADSRQPDE